MSPIYVIAEGGSCHDGTIEGAAALILAAKRAGADAIKFQFWSSAKRMAERRRAPEYQPIYERYRMPVVWFSPLKNAAEAAGIEFLCTAYLPEDVPTVARWSERIKVASFEAGDGALITALLETKQEVIVSLGMMAHTSERHAVMRQWASLPVWAFLHCVSAYPCPPQAATVGLVRTLPSWTHQDVARSGYSDHTLSVLTGAVAVGAGATVLEKHLRGFGTSVENPDYPAALDPERFEEYVRNVREAAILAGTGWDGGDEPNPAEDPMRDYRVR